MKTYRDLYPYICNFENLLLAFQRAAKGKRRKEDVAAFEYHLEDNLVDLQDELQAQTYAPGGYHSFRIYDPKPRLISAAPFRDRVVHHALCNVIEPIFERRFICDSYAGRRLETAATRTRNRPSPVSIASGSHAGGFRAFVAAV